MFWFLRLCSIANQLAIACQASRFWSTISLEHLLECVSYLSSTPQSIAVLCMQFVSRSRGTVSICCKVEVCRQHTDVVQMGRFGFVKGLSTGVCVRVPACLVTCVWCTGFADRSRTWDHAVWPRGVCCCGGGDATVLRNMCSSMWGADMLRR